MPRKNYKGFHFFKSCKPVPDFVSTCPEEPFFRTYGVQKYRNYFLYIERRVK